MTATLKPYGPYLVFLAAMLWASDAPFRVYLTESLSSGLIVLVEHGIALVILLPFLYWYRSELRTLTFRQWQAVLFIGVGGSALALLLFTESFSYMNPSVVILLQKLQPLIAIYLAVNFLGELTSRRFWTWAGVAIGAAYLISFPNLVPQLYVGEEFNPHIIGALLALSAAVLWGASTVLGRYLLDTVSFQLMTALRFLVAFAFLLIFNLYNGTLTGLTTLTGQDILFLFIISITSGVVAMYIYYRGLAAAKASVATIAELGFPVGAVLVNYVFLDALLSPVQLLGVVILLFAVYKLSKVNQNEYMKNAFIIHGTEGFPEENWFPWLKEELQKKGYEVFVPQFPTPENQDPEHWFTVFKAYQKYINEHTIIVAHSGGCAFLLRLLETIDVKIKCAVFVAPPIGVMPIKYIEADKPFITDPFNWEKIRNSASNFLVFHSEDDPFICVENGEKVANELGVNLVRLKDAGHFNAKAGYTKFELLLEKLNSVV